MVLSEPEDASRKPCRCRRCGSRATPSFDAYAKVAGVVNARALDSGTRSLIATITTAGILVTSLMAGYAFAKYRFRGRDGPVRAC